MRKSQQIIFIVFYTFLFSISIFIGKELFFPSQNFEERYVEPTPGTVEDLVSSQDDFVSFSWVSLREAETRVQDLLYEEYKNRYQDIQRSKVSFRYIPTSLEEKVEYSYAPLAESFLYNRNILTNVDSMGLYLYNSIWDTRGRMKSKNIHMYGILERSDEEFLSVLIHEFAHYHDIYTFSRSPFWDTSQGFYDISWQSVTTINAGLDIQDFVSGYAMTNQYEDFAETYTYYIFHNEDFLKKALDSEVLAKKYVFMKDVVFQNDMFLQEDFSPGNEVKDYYWDITKLPVDVKNFLQYMDDAI